MEILVWFYFTLACFGLAITPGPNALLVMTHSVRFGPSITIYTIIGGVFSFVILMLLSMFGIDILLKKWPSILDYVKIFGGFYIIWLGLRQLWDRNIYLVGSNESKSPTNRISLFMQGAASALSNPKVILFFGAFLTQFINPHKNILNQYFIMVLTFAMAEFCVEMFINLTSGKFRNYLLVHGHAFNVVCGSMFIIIGIMVLLMR